MNMFVLKSYYYTTGYAGDIWLVLVVITVTKTLGCQPEHFNGQMLNSQISKCQNSRQKQSKPGHYCQLKYKGLTTLKQ